MHAPYVGVDNVLHEQMEHARAHRIFAHTKSERFTKQMSITEHSKSYFPECDTVCAMVALARRLYVS